MRVINNFIIFFWYLQIIRSWIGEIKNVKSVLIFFLNVLTEIRQWSFFFPGTNLILVFVYLRSFVLKCQIVTFNCLSDSNGHNPSLWPWADDSVALTVQLPSVMAVTPMPLVISYLLYFKLKPFLHHKVKTEVILLFNFFFIIYLRKTAAVVSAYS